ncbi:MAG: hypothetical protein WDO24_24950 [Pseudomonadota bacterium]
MPRPCCGLFGQVDLDRYFDVQAGFDALVADAIGQGGAHHHEARHRRALHHGEARHRQAAARPASGPVSDSRLGHDDAPKSTRCAAGSWSRACSTNSTQGSTSRSALEVDGRIRAVSGGGAERATLERALRRAGGGEYGYVIHFTHGLHPAARFTGDCFVEDMRVIGSDAVGLGLPWWQPGGGENHPDAVLSMQSLWLAGTQIVADGTIVAPRALAEQAGGLAGARAMTDTLAVQAQPTRRTLNRGAPRAAADLCRSGLPGAGEGKDLNARLAAGRARRGAGQPRRFS